MSYPRLPHWMKCWGCGLNHEPSDHGKKAEPKPDDSEPEPEAEASDG